MLWGLFQTTVSLGKSFSWDDGGEKTSWSVPLPRARVVQSNQGKAESLEMVGNLLLLSDVSCTFNLLQNLLLLSHLSSM